jgi:hypothetical protein
MRKGVTIKEIGELIDMRLELLRCQRFLWWSRVTGQPRPVIHHWEGYVKTALDRVWCAQLCVGEFDAS